ncbi:MAG TPA: alpha/beta hydrolase [Patescibacteria group bacterium]|jgi:pimeloyl-ACP methyl ester carboxylesterase|nr:alpha/beta hydrolase [Patescibacteria group bacterium]
MTNKATRHVVIINGSHLHYWIYNPHQTRTVFMIHGFRGSHFGLMYIIRLLPKYRIIVPDLPGFGESTSMSKVRHDIDGYASCILKLLEVLKLKQTVLLGHSFGTIIASKIAAERPTSITELILISPVTLPQIKASSGILLDMTRLYYGLVCSLPNRIGQFLLSNRLFALISCFTLIKTPDRQARRETYVFSLNNVGHHHTISVVREAFEASITGAVMNYVDSIKSRTLIITGRLDNLTRLPAQKRLAARLKNKKLVIIEQSGHLAHLEAPATIATAIETFLDEA